MFACLHNYFSFCFSKSCYGIYFCTANVFSVNVNDRSDVRYVTLTFEISVPLVFKRKVGNQKIIELMSISFTYSNKIPVYKKMGLPFLTLT